MKIALLWAVLGAFLAYTAYNVVNGFRVDFWFTAAIVVIVVLWVLAIEPFLKRRNAT
jgi:hypothetical protein